MLLAYGNNESAIAKASANNEPAAYNARKKNMRQLGNDRYIKKNEKKSVNARSLHASFVKWLVGSWSTFGGKSR